MAQQNNHDNGNNQMNIDNDTIFQLLVELKSDVSSLDSTVKGMQKTVASFSDDLNEVKEKAEEANNRSKELAHKEQSRTSFFLYAWIPLLGIVLAAVIGHIRIM